MHVGGGDRARALAMAERVWGTDWAHRNARHLEAFAGLLLGTLPVVELRTEPLARVTHLGRGTSYDVIQREAILQTTRPLADGDRVVIYRGDDGSLWPRRQEDFDDGRFRPLDATGPEGGHGITITVSDAPAASDAAPPPDAAIEEWDADHHDPDEPRFSFGRIIARGQEILTGRPSSAHPPRDLQPVEATGCAGVGVRSLGGMLDDGLRAEAAAAPHDRGAEPRR